MNRKISLGIDTSNYSTSVCYLSGDKKISKTKLLDIKIGERGLRQNEAFFQHIKNLPLMLEDLFDKNSLEVVGVSSKPRNTEGSYMPCFLAGKSIAKIISDTLNIPIKEFSHQQGHIASAIYYLNMPNLLNEKFYAFHNSGGTMELLFCNGIDDIIIASRTEDITAGQLIDRIGVNLGYPFPAGKYISDLATENINKTLKIKLKDGNCNLSGIENKANEMIDKGIPKEYIATYVLEYISETMLSMLDHAKENYGKEYPVIMVGGVNSSLYIRNRLQNKNIFFVDGEYSRDNAVGIAYLSSIGY